MLQTRNVVTAAQSGKVSLADLNVMLERSFQRAQRNTGDCHLPAKWSPADIPVYVQCLMGKCEDQDGSLLDGFLCEELVPMATCEADLSEFSPHFEAGTTTAMLCPLTCEACGQPIPAPAPAPDQVPDPVPDPVPAPAPAECQGIIVLSIEHESDTMGKYFHFDEARTEEIWQYTLQDREDFTVVCDRTGETTEVTIWDHANGGSIGDAHGRLSEGAAEGDWEVGDCLTLAAPIDPA